MKVFSQGMILSILASEMLSGKKSRHFPLQEYHVNFPCIIFAIADYPVFKKKLTKQRTHDRKTIIESIRSHACEQLLCIAICTSIGFSLLQQPKVQMEKERGREGVLGLAVGTTYS